MSERLAVVIGGSGFVGKRVALFAAGLAPEGGRPSGWPSFDRVRVVDVAPWSSSEATPAPIEFEKADVRDRAAIEHALRGATVVFHLASVVDVSLRPGPRIDEVNVAGTRNVVEACRSLGIPTLVYTSSEDVVLSEVPVAFGDETIAYPTQPIHAYVRTKIEGEKLALGANGGALRTVAIRPVHVYGPDDPHAIVTTLRAFKEGTVPFLLGDGRARFDVIYVDNVAHAHLLAAAKLEDPGTRDRVGGQAYFVGEGERPDYFDFVRPYAAAKGISMPKRRLGKRGTALAARVMELVGTVTGRDVPFHRFHQRVIGADFFFTDQKARTELGYAPLVTPAEGQRRTIAWLDRVPL
jgi:sterol-4alpha-carboxylate 3-dehydrogenase (decarboxylating)